MAGVELATPIFSNEQKWDQKESNETNLTDGALLHSLSTPIRTSSRQILIRQLSPTILIMSTFLDPPTLPSNKAFLQATPAAAVHVPSKDHQPASVTDVAKIYRRTCSVAGCNNGIVQGGLCVSHGAKRRTCKFPGCMKNSKMAGMCSKHGPPRKKCGHDGCVNVAVKGTFANRDISTQLEHSSNANADSSRASL